MKRYRLLAKATRLIENHRQAILKELAFGDADNHKANEYFLLHRLLFLLLAEGSAKITLQSLVNAGQEAAS